MPHNKDMRILHVLSQTELTGSEVYAHTLIEDQIKKGHKVWVASDRLHLDFRAEKILFPFSDSSLSSKLRSFLLLTQLIKANNIELVHCHSRGASRHLYPVTRVLKVAMVTSLHGRQHYSFSKRIFDSYGEFVIAICENLQRTLVQEFKMNPSKIKVLRNPVDSTKFSMQPLATSGQILIVTRTTGRKGEILTELITHCFERWLKHRPSLTIKIIASDPKQQPRAWETFKDLDKKYPGRLQWTESSSSVAEEYKNAQLVIGGGRVAIEAVLCGRELLCIGENSFLGSICRDNIALALASNFGDIGAGQRELEIDLEKLTKSLYAKLENPSSQVDRQWLRSQIEQEFSSERLIDEITSLYRRARIKRSYPYWIPILMYHRVPSSKIESQHKIYIEMKYFEMHLKYFRWLGFETIWFSELEEFFQGSKKFSKKPLILTFDDGYQDNVVNVLPLLEKYQIKANLFLLADKSIQKNNWDAEEAGPPALLMNEAERQQLANSSFEIGSHGFDHQRMTDLPKDKAFEQMLLSKQALEDEFGKAVTALAYPFGSTSKELALLAKKAGYSFAVNTDSGGLHPADDPHSLFRVNIFPQDGFWAILKKTSRFYRRYFYWKKEKR